MTSVHVDPGICGLKSVIRTATEDGQTVKIEIESECPSIEALGAALPEADAFQVCFARFSDSPVYKAADANFKHAACPVPSAIVKAIEAEAGLSLGKEVSFRIEKT